MKITIFSQHFWPENFRINDLAFALSKKVTAINIFTGKPNYSDGKIKKSFQSHLPQIKNFKNIEIIRFPIISRGSASSLRLILNYISYILSVTFFGFFLKKKLGDIFFVYATSPIFQAIPAIFLGRLFKRPVVLWVQDLWPENLVDTGYIKNKIIIKIVKTFVKIIYDYSDLILCQSQDFYRVIKKITNTNSKIFYNPSNYKFRARERKNLKKKYFDFYYTGNLGKGQSISKLLKIFSNEMLIKNKIRLFIYGGGKEFKLIDNYIKKNKYSNISLNKPVSSKKLKKRINKADCFILKLNEGYGLSKTIPAKFQTYLSFGIPILSINKGIVSNIIKNNKIGYACSTKNTSDLYKLIIKIKKLKFKELQQIYKNSEKLYYKNFEINSSCKKLKKYLEALS